MGNHPYDISALTDYLSGNAPLPREMSSITDERKVAASTDTTVQAGEAGASASPINREESDADD